MSLFLIGSDIFSFLHHLRYRNHRSTYLPKISIIIPAHNEANSILHSVTSVLNSDYPLKKIEVIVVDDGSTDDTVTVLKSSGFTKNGYITIISQTRSGKAAALNTGIRNFSSGELVMCLDADSYLDKNALKNIVKYFENPQIAAMASNVKIEKSKGLLNLIQRFEYLVCYQMKRAQTVFNIEYIIGGVGSVFRKDVLDRVGYYDGNTVTEDIDLTMKLLKNGNKNTRVIYAPDVIAYTQSVISIKDLIKQRYRWKWGRTQTFFKNKSMFFTRDKRFTRPLTWIYLPYALLSDLIFLLEPFFVMYILFLLVRIHDIFTFLSAFMVVSAYLMLNIISEESISLKDKLRYIFLAPAMYFLFYVLSYVEYAALVKSLVNLPNLRSSLEKDLSHWKPVQRLGFR